MIELGEIAAAIDRPRPVSVLGSLHPEATPPLLRSRIEGSVLYRRPGPGVLPESDHAKIVRLCAVEQPRQGDVERAAQRTVTEDEWITHETVSTVQPRTLIH
jgi:hypothetical protein